MSKVNSAASGAAAGTAVMPGWGTAIGGAAGFLMGSDDNSSAMYDEMMRKAQSIPLPVLKEYYPELYKQVAMMNPELETAVNLGPSEMAGVSTDPALRQAQMNALSKLTEVGDAGGRDARFLSDAAKLENEVNTNLQGQQGAIMQNLATRGLSGGGSELVARSMAAQQAANSHGNQALELNAQAQERALQALMQSGQLGGQIQQQDFSQQSAKAQAADAISKFNAANQQQVMSNNVGTKNQAQQLNMTNAQNVANQNTSGSNQAQQYNLGLAQQQYDNQLKKLGLANDAGKAAAKNSADQAANQDKFLGGLTSAAGQWYANSNKPQTQAQPSSGSVTNWQYDPNKRSV